MKEEILRLKQENPTWGYKKIAKSLGYSRSTVVYFLRPNEKESCKLRKRKRDKTINGIFKRKKDNFQRNYRLTKSKRQENIQRRLPTFTAKQLKEKCFDNPTCYLTGRQIDLTNGKSFELDHIIPVSKGGDNSLINCGLTCTPANRAKSDLNLNEFIELCKEILIYNGFKIEKMADNTGVEPDPL